MRRSGAARLLSHRLPCAAPRVQRVVSLSIEQSADDRQPALEVCAGVTDTVLANLRFADESYCRGQYRNPRKPQG